jgi:hypothetical protein
VGWEGSGLQQSPWYGLRVQCVRIQLAKFGQVRTITYSSPFSRLPLTTCYIASGGTHRKHRFQQCLYCYRNVSTSPLSSNSQLYNTAYPVLASVCCLGNVFSCHCLAMTASTCSTIQAFAITWHYHILRKHKMMWGVEFRKQTLRTTTNATNLTLAYNLLTAPTVSKARSVPISYHRLLCSLLTNQNGISRCVSAPRQLIITKPPWRQDGI